jgi:hypothetical protein
VDLKEVYDMDDATLFRICKSLGLIEPLSQEVKAEIVDLLDQICPEQKEIQYIVEFIMTQTGASLEDILIGY